MSKTIHSFQLPVCYLIRLWLITLFNPWTIPWKLTCTDYVDFEKSQDKLGHFSSFKNNCNYSDVQFKVLKRDDNMDFCPVQNLTKGEADFKKFMRLKKQLVNPVEKFGR